MCVFSEWAGFMYLDLFCVCVHRPTAKFFYSIFCFAKTATALAAVSCVSPNFPRLQKEC